MIMTKVEIDVPEEIVPYTVLEDREAQITITGTIGVLAQAFDEGLLTKEDVERCIEWLRESEIRISEKLYKKLREHVG